MGPIWPCCVVHERAASQSFLRKLCMQSFLKRAFFLAVACGECRRDCAAKHPLGFEGTNLTLCHNYCFSKRLIRNWVIIYSFSRVFLAEDSLLPAYSSNFIPTFFRWKWNKQSQEVNRIRLTVPLNTNIQIRASIKIRGQIGLILTITVMVVFIQSQIRFL